VVVVKDRERLEANKQSFHRERYNLKTLNKAEAKEQYRVEV
jgi:hypothetical protein